MGDHPNHDQFIDRTGSTMVVFKRYRLVLNRLLKKVLCQLLKFTVKSTICMTILILSNQEKPQLSQMYIVGGGEKRVQFRCSHYLEVKRVLVKQLQNMLHTENKYI